MKEFKHPVLIMTLAFILMNVPNETVFADDTLPDATTEQNVVLDGLIKSFFSVLPEATDAQSNDSAPLYTAAEFDALPDAEKKEIYQNSPELLPINFDPSMYWEVLHSDSGS